MASFCAAAYRPLRILSILAGRMRKLSSAPHPHAT